MLRIVVNESGEDDTFAFTIEEQTCAMSNSTEPVISVKLDVLIDSGSAGNLISKDTLQELKVVRNSFMARANWVLISEIRHQVDPRHEEQNIRLLWQK